MVRIAAIVSGSAYTIGGRVAAISACIAKAFPSAVSPSARKSLAAIAVFSAARSFATRPGHSR